MSIWEVSSVKVGRTDEDINKARQDPDIQYQSQVGPTLRVRNLVGNQDQILQISDIYQLMFQEHP